MDTLLSEGGLVTLRALRRSDGAAFATLCGIPEVARQLGHAPLPLSTLGAEGFIDISNANRANGRAFDYAVLEGDAFAGVMGLWAAGDAWSLGYWIAKPFWGRGLATRAGSILIAEAARWFPERALVAQVFADNPASARVLRKLGFVETPDSGRSFSMARLQSVDTRTYRRNAGLCGAQEATL